jgi:hypothetical protein
VAGPRRLAGGAKRNGAERRTQVLQREFRRGELQVLLLRYTMALITQMSQTAVAIAHSAEQQLCRWLLMSWTACLETSW